MKLIKALFIAGFVSGITFALATAKPEYAKKEKKACTYCHVKMGTKELNDAGKYYKEHNHSLEGYKAPAGKKK